MEMDGFEGILDDDIDLGEITPEVVVNDETILIDDSLFDDNIIDTPVDDTILNQLLLAKGIKNATITIVDENNEEQEINFHDLSREDQLEILNSPETIPDENLDDSEIQLINHLRTNNLSVEDFLAQYKESILADLQDSADVSYDIDAYDDHELFLLDLKNKYDLTDEELQSELEKELTNEDLFTKKVTKLRAEYKLLEDEYKTNQQKEFQAKEKERYDEFKNAMSNVAEKVSDFHGVYLEDNEKQETLSYLIDLDETGVSRFSKDLNSPNKLYEAAWYLRYGKEAFQALENAYEAEIAKLKKVDKPRVVVRNSDKPIKNINDLNF